MYYWRTLWCGKWGATKHKWSEEDIKQRSPEAIRLDESRDLRLLPETEEELRAAQENTAGPMTPPAAPGQRKLMAWEVSHAAQETLRK